MGRFIVIVLDGFGMQAMRDAAIARPGDETSSTLGSILHDFPDLKLPNLEALGLMNAFGKESACMKFSPDATFGKSELMHFGADTFQGHQEIMGTNGFLFHLRAGLLLRLITARHLVKPFAKIVGNYFCHNRCNKS